MTTSDDTTSTSIGNLEEIDHGECLTLLASLSIGRIAVNQPGSSPLVVPVNYTLDGEVVVFRSDPGSKLAAMQGQLVSFQVDFVDPFHRTGWSVLVRGAADEIIQPQVEHVVIDSWASGEKHHWVRISPDVISGRRIRLPDIELDGRGYL